MMIHVLYFSQTGNTKHFISGLERYASSEHRKSSRLPMIDARRTEQTDLFKVKHPFFCFVPTYLEGTTEIVTDSMHDELGYAHNYERCLGSVCNGNRNFNRYFCYTGKIYRQELGIPIIYKYELRGMPDDVKACYKKIRTELGRRNQNGK